MHEINIKQNPRIKKYKNNGDLEIQISKYQNSGMKVWPLKDEYISQDGMRGKKTDFKMLLAGQVPQAIVIVQINIFMLRHIQLNCPECFDMFLWF